MKETRNKLKIIGLLLTFVITVVALGIFSLTAGAADGNACASTVACTGTYKNGFCTVCDGYEQPTLNADGYYEIDNAGKLYWFAGSVDNDNANFCSAKAVLTDNITVNTSISDANGRRNWNPIGYYSATDDYAEFSGTFDGNGKTVSGLYFSDDEVSCVGLIAHTVETAVVKNVTLTNSYFRGAYNIGGIVGSNYGTISGCVNGVETSGEGQIGGITGKNEGTVELCGNTGSVTGGWSDFAGGIAGVNRNTIRNCWNTANIESQDYYVGGIAGANNGDDGAVPLIENCWSTGNAISVAGRKSVGGVVGRCSTNKGGVRNCYSVMKPVGTIINNHPVTNTEQKTLDQFASGEVAYLLNGDQSTIVFKQTLGENGDATPNFTGATVYYGYTSCAEDAKIGYTNDDKASATKPAHTGDITYVITSDGTQHVAIYDCCGSEITEAHTVAYTAKDNVITYGCTKCKAVFSTATVNAAGATYNGSAKETATVIYSNGWIGGELPISYENNKNAGTASASITVEGVSARVEFTIAKADITLTPPTAVTGLNYSGSPQALHTAVQAVGGTLKYSLDGSTWDDAVCYRTDAGEYTVYYKVEGDTNHNDVAVQSFKVTVSKATLKVKADAVSKIYCESDPTLSYTVEGLLGNDTKNNVMSGALSRENGENVGAYDITLGTLSAGNNYSISYFGAELTVDPKPITEDDIDLDGILTYNGSEQTQNITVTDGIAYTVSGNSAIGAGDYTMTVTASGNYTGSVSVPWSIGKKTLVITAENKAVCVGDALPAFTYTVEGLINGETLNATPTVSANAEMNTAGKYDVTVSGAKASDNYSITYVSGVLNVRDHVYIGAVTTPPTCVSGGAFTYTCSYNSAHSYTERLGIREDAHSWNSGVVTIAPTCTSNGEKTFTCMNNSEHKKTEDVAIDEKAHVWNDGAVTTAPTCATAGVKTFTCTLNSAHSYTEEVAIDENAHTWNNGVVLTAPTCSAKGKMTFSCINNGEHTKTEEVDAIGHTEETVAGKSASCNEKGLTDGKACSVCGEILAEQAEIEATGHKYDDDCDGDCNVCAETRADAKHVDADDDHTCDKCSAELSKDGISGGAVAAIVIGIAAVAGFVIFLLFGFAIKKKK